ncbi:leucyl aminopeptidase [Marinobacter daqiaonensis]|uniref:Leucyl aminopeptidase n=1 Tax=Marinobacter daqiaonensis TaxID=650891 RepID=A0A1I6IDF3_9GAMM|nr:leucyl aminopeptidase family protein [Marinobacter daqiaonensis]SFR64807.1 leucyl aminopeptidase [Marinobacter daqiaonensis]
MKPELPIFTDLKLEKDPEIPASWDFGGGVGLILLAPESQRDAIRQGPWGEFLEQRLAAFPEKANPVHLSGPTGIRTAVAFVADDVGGFKALTQARKLIGPLLTERPEQINVISLLGNGDTATVMAEALAAATHAALFQLPKITDTPEDAPTLRTMVFMGDFDAANFRHAEATAEGNNLARWLTQLPGNYLTPAIYRDYAESLARNEGWDTDFFDQTRLEELGAGAFLSVVAASPNRDAGILRLSYRPRDAKGQALALIGKGICFDTGGANLKVGGSMLGMHGDMQGSAVALGTLLALTRLEFDQPVDCWLPLAENHIGPDAVKCNDVITAMNGTTIELINTDAEGRMVLADTLALASREKPRAILDYATLTGAVVSSLGQRMGGAITNRRHWIEPIIQAGERSGERVWPFPYEDDYDEDLKSQVADTLQCRTAGAGDHIYAARFLGRFVDKDIDWVHVDMASSGTHKGGLAHIPTDLQGFGVRFGVEWFGTITRE